jgi:hypothetical protein
MQKIVFVLSCPSIIIIDINFFIIDFLSYVISSKK